MITRIFKLSLVAMTTLLPFAANNAAQAITFDWATIGDVGNADDIHGFGAGGVDYEFRISKTEVTNAQYVEFLNDVAATDTHGLYNPDMDVVPWAGITRSGSSGSYAYSVKPDALGQGPGGSDYSYANKPVVFVYWLGAIRFANWLTSGSTESGTYTLNSSTPNSIPNHATLGAGHFFLPSEDEWYKAAYYDGGSATYYDYATGTDTLPNNNLPTADTGNSANFKDAEFATGDHDYPYTDVGAYTTSVSPYGTFDQSGNAWEWLDTSSGSWEELRGGSAHAPDITLGATWTEIHTSIGGFRIATAAESAVAVPEPSTLLLGGISFLALFGFAYRKMMLRYEV